MTEDRYAKFDYRSLIAWNERLEREWPFLQAVLSTVPLRKVLDLGAGTGEHARLLASKGFEVVGMDTSPAMLEKSRAIPAENVRFVEGDMRDIPIDEQFGAAICLGNALPHLTGEDDLRRMASNLRRVLVAGGALILQMLNYDRLEAKHERAIPLSFLHDPEDPQATVIFLRTVELLPDGRAIFMPTTLRQRPDREPPIELIASRRVEIRAWRRAGVEAALRANGFSSFEAWGSYAKAPFEPAESRDLILVAKH